jgi:hypothetical protein
MWSELPKVRRRLHVLPRQHTIACASRIGDLSAREHSMKGLLPDEFFADTGGQPTIQPLSCEAGQASDGCNQTGCADGRRYDPMLSGRGLLDGLTRRAKRKAG